MSMCRIVNGREKDDEIIKNVIATPTCFFFVLFFFVFFFFWVRVLNWSHIHCLGCFALWVWLFCSDDDRVFVWGFHASLTCYNLRVYLWRKSRGQENLFLVVVFLGLAFLSDNRFLFEDFKPLGVYILIYIFDKNLLLL